MEEERFQVNGSSGDLLADSTGHPKMNFDFLFSNSGGLPDVSALSAPMFSNPFSFFGYGKGLFNNYAISWGSLHKLRKHISTSFINKGMYNLMTNPVSSSLDPKSWYSQASRFGRAAILWSVGGRALARMCATACCERRGLRETIFSLLRTKKRKISRVTIFSF